MIASQTTRLVKVVFILISLFLSMMMVLVVLPIKQNTAQQRIPQPQI
jgi:preprotein translocase subunit SecG